MESVYISGESLEGTTYKSFIDYLLRKSDMFSYEILKLSDEIRDTDDKKYYDIVLNTERFFQSFYKKKNIDKRNCLKSFVYLNSSLVKEYLKKANSIYDWNYPDGIENLSFFEKDKCIFESITHENYFVFYPATNCEVKKLQEFGVVIL